MKTYMGLYFFQHFASKKKGKKRVLGIFIEKLISCHKTALALPDNVNCIRMRAKSGGKFVSRTRPLGYRTNALATLLLVGNWWISKIDCALLVLRFACIIQSKYGLLILYVYNNIPIKMFPTCLHYSCVGDCLIFNHFC